MRVLDVSDSRTAGRCNVVGAVLLLRRHGIELLMRRLLLRALGDQLGDRLELALSIALSAAAIAGCTCPAGLSPV